MDIQPSTRPREAIANAEILLFSRNRNSKWHALVVTEIAQLRRFAQDGNVRLQSETSVEGQEHIRKLIEELEKSCINLEVAASSPTKAIGVPWMIIASVVIAGVAVAIMGLYFFASRLLPSSNGSDARQTRTTSQQLTTSSQLSAQDSCGIALFGSNVRIWIEGQNAQQVCNDLVQSVRKGGGQPSSWNGQLTIELSDAAPVCSDILPKIKYEVVDTGANINGSSWCQWMTQKYGASKNPTNPDLFGIIKAVRQASLTVTNEAQQVAESARKSVQATTATKKAVYAAACKAHNGYTGDSGNCVVDYPGWSHQRVAIQEDGAWDVDRAESERRQCEMSKADADAAEKNGRPWTTPPQYHPDTGVCSRGSL